MTDSKGDFVFENVPTGNYLIKFPYNNLNSTFCRVGDEFVNCIVLPFQTTKKVDMDYENIFLHERRKNILERRELEKKLNLGLGVEINQLINSTKANSNSNQNINLNDYKSNVNSTKTNKSSIINSSNSDNNKNNKNTKNFRVNSNSDNNKNNKNNKNFRANSPRTSRYTGSYEIQNEVEINEENNMDYKVEINEENTMDSCVLTEEYLAKMAWS